MIILKQMKAIRIINYSMKLTSKIGKFSFAYLAYTINTGKHLLVYLNETLIVGIFILKIKTHLPKPLIVDTRSKYLRSKISNIILASFS